MNTAAEADIQAGFAEALAAALARRFTSDAQTLRQVYWGALLHDIGKIGIADAILLSSCNGPR